jgi:tyrosyl-tRNA synthetase
MTTDERINLITRNLEETLTIEELKALIESETPLKHYIGFEISGKVHLGQGLFTMMKVKDLVEAGAECTIFLADWHTWLNKKLDGTFETANRLAKEYFKEALIASYICIGGNPNDLKFIQGTDLYKENQNYWATMVEVSQNTTLARMQRSITIAGRKEGESVDFAILLYPAMQAADIFAMQINIAHAGLDQRKAHAIAKDVAMQIKTNPLKDKSGKQIKPVAIHQHLLLGLKINEEVVKALKDQTNLSADEKTQFIESIKMSKSKPETCVFITDSPEDIKRKVNNAYAPEGEIEYNPILDWTKYLIFYSRDSSLTINRPEKFGGDVTYSSYEDLEKDYFDKKLHPMDLKNAAGKWLVDKLAPAREYFEDPKRQAALLEIEKLTTKS